MTVSVVTVTYNAAATVEEAVQSVVEQVGDFALDYHIVDGGSTDQTLERIRPFEDRIAQVTSGKDQGLYDAMNRGVARAKGDIIGILNADDRLRGPTRSSPTSPRPLRRPAPMASTPTLTTWTRPTATPSRANGSPALQATSAKGGCRPTPPSL